MPWPTRHEPDPLKARRRQLAEQERLLAERMSQLTRELKGDSDEAIAAGKKAAEPPVWRMEEDITAPRPFEPPASRRKGLARQRQRDRVIFFLCTAVLLAIIGLVIWLWKTRVEGS